MESALDIYAAFDFFKVLTYLTSKMIGYNEFFAIQASSDVDSNEIEVLKSQLFALSASCDRGFGASPNDRKRAKQLIDKLSELNPNLNATMNLFPNNISVSDHVPIEGSWKLVYTSALDVVSLAASPLTLIQGIYQVISRDGRSANIIDLAPRIQALFPQFIVGSGSTLRLKVGTWSSARTPTRVGLSFRTIQAQPLSLLGTAVDFLPKFSSFLPQAAITGVDREGPGYFDVLFLDHNCLIIAQNAPGGVFVSIRSEEETQLFL
jgi:hypothetical protein